MDFNKQVPILIFHKNMTYRATVWLLREELPLPFFFSLQLWYELIKNTNILCCYWNYVIYSSYFWFNLYPSSEGKNSSKHFQRNHSRSIKCDAELISLHLPKPGSHSVSHYDEIQAQYLEPIILPHIHSSLLPCIFIHLHILYTHAPSKNNTVNCYLQFLLS